MIEFFNTAISFLVVNYIPALVVYIIGGVIYALVKWVHLLYKLRSYVNDITENDLTKAAKTWSYLGPDEVLNRIRQIRAIKIFGGHEQNYPVRVKDNVGLLGLWAFFWPINLVWTLVADVTQEIFSFIYRKTADMMNAISDAILPN